MAGSSAQNREALYTGGPEQHNIATVAATVAATPELRGIYSLTAGMQLYIGIGHISIIVALMGGVEFPRRCYFCSDDSGEALLSLHALE